MTNLNITDVRPFLPARNFDVSLDFYQALGWSKLWSDDSLAVLEVANQRLYLQNYYVREWAENCMLHVSVEDAAAWKERLLSLSQQEKFSEVRVQGPKKEDYGALVTHGWDPSGVLLHFAQWDR